jgi:hypothetical protein
MKIMANLNSENQPYPLTRPIFEQLKAANLTATDWIIWMYLATHNDEQFIPQWQIMDECQVGSVEYYQAKTKFKKSGLLPIGERCIG